MRIGLGALFVFYLLFSCQLVFAQSITNTGEIYGRALDDEEQSLPGVFVTIHSKNTPDQSLETGQLGSYRFLNLTPGIYTVRFALSGYSEILHDKINVNIGGHVEVNGRMKRSLQEAITVSGEASMLDRKKTSTSFVYTKEFIDNVPNGRDPWFLLAMTAGVDSSRLDTGSSSVIQAAVFGRGDQFENNTWNYDGLNRTDPGSPGSVPAYMDFEAFQEIEIITGGSDVSLQTGGVAVNLVTKRGGNSWDGQTSLFRGSELFDYGLQIGGPIIKDKLFAWAAYRFVNDHTKETFVRTKSTIADINAKLSFNLNKAHSTQISYFRGDKNVENRDPFGNGSAPEACWRQYSEPPNAIMTLEHTWLPSNQFLLSTRYGFDDAAFGLKANGGTDKPMIVLFPPFHGENTTYTVRVNNQSHHINLDSNYFKEAFAGGDHEFRFGFEFRTSNIHSFSTYGNGILIGDYYQTINNGPLTAGYLKVQHQVLPNRTRQNVSFFASDTFRKDRLTLNLGIRFDHQTGHNQASDVPAVAGFEQFVGAFHYPGGESPIVTNDFSPRFGLTYSITKDNKTLFKANFARYYDAYNPYFLTHSNPAAVYNGADFYYVNKNGDRTITPDEIIDGPYDYGGNVGGTFDLNAFAATRLYDSNLSNGWTNEFILRMEREVARDFSIAASYNYRRYGNFLRILPSGVSSEDYVPGGTFTATTDLGNFNVPYYVLGFEHDGTAILKNITDYQESYHGLDITLQKRMSHNFMLNGSFTIQRQIGIYNGGDSLAFTTERSNGVTTYPFDPTNLPFMNNQPYSYAGFGGSINPQSNWSFKWSGVYLFPWEISAGAFVRYQQGYPMVLFGRVFDDSLNAFFGHRQHLILIEPAGSRRYPNVFTTDFQIQKAFDLDRLGKVSAILTIFNLFNGQPEVNGPRVIFDGDTAPSGPESTTLDARSYRFGLRYSF